MQITFKVTTTDSTYEVTTTFANVVEWERKFQKKVSDFTKGAGYEDMAFLAFVASKSAGHTTPAVFDDFIKKIVDLDVIGEEAINPTQAAAGVTD